MTFGKVPIIAADDDTRMLCLVRRILELEGYQVFTASCGQDALEMLYKTTARLVLLDVMMAGLDGYAVCRQIREFSQIPIILVTAKTLDHDKVAGLDAGADDYITKPFSASELVARVRAVLRRAGQWEGGPEPEFNQNGLIIDSCQHQIKLNDQTVKLTATEYRLISCLCQNAGRVMTPDQLLAKVWGEEYCGENHLLQVNIARLRKKIGDEARQPRFITTLPGIGYMMPKAVSSTG